MLYIKSVQEFFMQNFNEFINYVYAFYGDGGIYDQKRTKEQIAFALCTYLDDIDARDDDYYSWGYGDSLDRERVRDVMNDIYGPVPVVANESHFNDTGVKILN